MGEYFASNQLSCYLVGHRLLACGPSGLLDFVLHALRVLRGCVTHTDVSMMHIYCMMHVSMMHISMHFFILLLMILGVGLCVLIDLCFKHSVNSTDLTA